jgi:hypothetical protein
MELKTTLTVSTYTAKRLTPKQTQDSFSSCRITYMTRVPAAYKLSHLEEGVENANDGHLAWSFTK